MKKNILLVSDSDGKWRTVAVALEKAGGYNLTIAKTLAEAQEQIRGETVWDAIFWDYFLGSDVTTDLTREVRQKFPDAKMVAFSYNHRYFPEQREAGCNFELDPATHPVVLERFIVQFAG